MDLTGGAGAARRHHRLGEHEAAEQPALPLVDLCVEEVIAATFHIEDAKKGRYGLGRSIGHVLLAARRLPCLQSLG